MKKTVAALLGLLVIIGLFTGLYAASRPAVNPGEKSFEVTVTHKDGTVKTVSYRSDQEYLGAFLEEEGLLEGEEGPFGLYITAVDGEQAIYEEDGAYWSFYQNGEYANQGVDLTPITDGDQYAFVYTNG